jgi:hypothetical protein
MMSEAMFELVSVARHGPGRRDKLSPSELAQIARTTRQVPEAMVKLPKCRFGYVPAAVLRHLGPQFKQPVPDTAGGAMNHLEWLRRPPRRRSIETLLPARITLKYAKYHREYT